MSNSRTDAKQRFCLTDDLRAMLLKLYGGTNDALYPMLDRIDAFAATPPRNEPHNHEGPAGSEPKPAPGLEFDARGVLVQNDTAQPPASEMAKASEEMLARWILKSLDWSGGNSDRNGAFLTEMLLEHRRQIAANGGRKASEHEAYIDARMGPGWTKQLADALRKCSSVNEEGK